MGYSTDLTDTQWELISDFFETKKGKNLRKHSKRELINAVMYRNKTGCQWRLLPSDFPNCDTIWSFYRRAVASGIWEKTMDKMVKKVRVDAGREPEPSYCLIDSQSQTTQKHPASRAIIHFLANFSLFLSIFHNFRTNTININERIWQGCAKCSLLRSLKCENNKQK